MNKTDVVLLQRGLNLRNPLTFIPELFFLQETILLCHIRRVSFLILVHYLSPLLRKVNLFCVFIIPLAQETSSRMQKAANINRAIFICEMV